MAPTIHCIRHGQGLHNLYSDYTIHDPPMTSLGEEECRMLQSTRFPPEKQDRISLIAASPLKRALQTAWLLFQPRLTQSRFPGQDTNASNSTMQILALPDAQETSSDPCDVGTDLPALSSFINSQDPPWPVDLSLLADYPVWNEKSFHGRFSPHSDAIKARARATRLFLREKVIEIMAKEGRDDVEIALVSHGGFMHYFSDDWEGAAMRPGTGWTNCEVRSYQFASPLPSPASALSGNIDNDPDARVVETLSSRKVRGLNHPMPSHSEQEKLFVEAMEGWEAQGLERPDRLEDPASITGPSPPRQGETAKTETDKVGGPERKGEVENEEGMDLGIDNNTERPRGTEVKVCA